MPSAVFIGRLLFFRDQLLVRRSLMIDSSAPGGPLSEAFSIARSAIPSRTGLQFISRRPRTPPSRRSAFIRPTYRFVAHPYHDSARGSAAVAVEMAPVVAALSGFLAFSHQLAGTWQLPGSLSMPVVAEC